jgi:DNA topoisomerase I
VAPKKLKGLVIVESPAKAKKISGFLGADYRVMASMGHVRDLPTNAAEIPLAIKKERWAQLGVNVESKFEPLYIVPPKKKKIIKELKAALKNAEELIVATDEDREGESIGWHLTQLLKPKVPVKRMVFSEITPEAIQAAVDNPREVDENLVTAQEVRRVLDRLYGYTLSPLLWKKVGRGLSAGRVQSVAVRLLVRREMERWEFRSGTYWDLSAALRTEAAASFEAELASVGGRRVASGRDFDESTGRLKADVDVILLDGDQAGTLQKELTQAAWKVDRIEERRQVRKPQPPFITSTLQQEASRKLNMTARQTMQLAQRLYEDGHITYMRTDSVHLSNEAIAAARDHVKKSYGEEYLSPEPRQFTTRNKGAQEAHEAIRPAGSEVRGGKELGLNGQELALYELIRRRTLATQMAEARLRFQTVTVTAGECEFRVTGRYVEFPGFFRVYVEGVDDGQGGDDEEAALPALEEGQELTCDGVEALSHQTKPPARYTEATLIRTLEAEGIGRPSTFASIIGTIQDRGYVRKSGNQLVPTFTALVVTRLLEVYFPDLIDLGFTANMEQMLDDVAAGEEDYLPYLERFYHGEAGLETQVRDKEETIDPRLACTLEFEGLSAQVRVGRYGPYVQQEHEGEMLTASIPEDLAPADLSNEQVDELIAQKQKKPRLIGTHPSEEMAVLVHTGPFGPYVQLGEEGKAKRVSLPGGLEPDEVDLDTAVGLLSLPRVLGKHPDTGKDVMAGIGRYGPYVVHERKYKPLPEGEEVLGVGLETAVKLLEQVRGRSGSVLRELGEHPDDGEPIAVYRGRYGPYVKHGKINASIPRGMEIDQVKLDEALGWLRESAQRRAEKGKK